MPANPQVGMTFQQEVAPGMQKTEQRSLTRAGPNTPADTFTDTISVRDSTRSAAAVAGSPMLVASDSSTMVRCFSCH